MTPAIFNASAARAHGVALGPVGGAYIREVANRLPGSAEGQVHGVTISDVGGPEAPATGPAAILRKLVETVKTQGRLLAVLVDRLGGAAEWLSTEEVRRHYGVARSSLYRLESMGVIRGSSSGPKRWHRGDLERHCYGRRPW